MQFARLKLVGFRGGFRQSRIHGVRGVRGTVADGVTRCRIDRVRWPYTDRVERFSRTIDIISAYADRQPHARAHADGLRRRVPLAVGQHQLRD